MESEQLRNAIYATAALTTVEGTRTCFAASISGLIRSNDDGHTWQDAYASLNPQKPITTIAIAGSPTFASDRYVLSGTIDGVLVSHDAGVTWSAIQLPAPPPAISSFAFSPNFDEDGTVFAGTLKDGVYRSTDRGQRWDVWNFGLTDLQVLDLAVSPDFANDQTLFAAAESGVYRSTNGGRSWNDVPFNPDLAPVISLTISPSYSADNTILAGTEACGLHGSTDRGQSWTPLGDGYLEGAVNAIMFSAEPTDHPRILVLAENRVVASSDGGTSWSEILLEPPPLASIASMVPIRSDREDVELLLGLMDGTTTISRGRVDATKG